MTNKSKEEFKKKLSKSVTEKNINKSKTNNKYNISVISEDSMKSSKEKNNKFIIRDTSMQYFDEIYEDSKDNFIQEKIRIIEKEISNMESSIKNFEDNNNQIKKYMIKI